MAHSHVAGVCQQHLDDKRIDATDQPTRSQDLNTTGTSGTSGFSSCHVTLRTVEELNDVLIQVWEEIPRRPPIVVSCFKKIHRSRISL